MRFGPVSPYAESLRTRNTLSASNEGKEAECRLVLFFSSLLGLETGDGVISVVRPVSPSWDRVSVSGSIPGSADSIRCFIGIPAACALDVYAVQLEAQKDASGYRRNTDTPGVYAARFDQDEFECMSYGPDNHSTNLRIVTVREVAV